MPEGPERRPPTASNTTSTRWTRPRTTSVRPRLQPGARWRWSPASARSRAYYDGQRPLRPRDADRPSIFSYDDGTDELEPIYNNPDQQFDFYTSTANAVQLVRLPALPRRRLAAGARTARRRSSTASSAPDDCDPSDFLIPVTRHEAHLRHLRGLVATSALVVVGSGASEDEGDEYLVRAIFDNASFLVEQEEVRIAGAKVGVDQSEVDVTLRGRARPRGRLRRPRQGGRRLATSPSPASRTAARTPTASSARSRCWARSSSSASRRSPARRAPSRRPSWR